MIVHVCIYMIVRVCYFTVLPRWQGCNKAIQRCACTLYCIYMYTCAQKGELVYIYIITCKDNCIITLFVASSNGIFA